MPDPERLERVAEELRSQNVDAIVCGLPCNVLMLTGYWPVVGNSAAAVTQDGSVRVLVPEDEEELARRAGVTELTTFKPGSLTELKPLPEVLAPEIESLVRSMGLQDATIAYESSGAFEPASYISMHVFGDGIFAMLENALESGSLVAADEMLARLRACLTPSELAQVREACRIAGGAFEVGRQAVRAGETELAAAAHFLGALSPATRSGGYVACMSGPNSAQAHGAFALSRTRALEHGDFVLVHCNSWLGGFWTDITRTYTLGEPGGKQEKVQKAIAEAREAALDRIRPGVAAREVDAAARAVMKKHDLGEDFKHDTGHGVGFAAIDHNALPRLHPKSPDVLETGMVFNVEPAAYNNEFGGSRHCDVVAVTGSGYELLTDFQSDPVSWTCQGISRAS